jgi:hypothetical protein
VAAKFMAFMKERHATSAVGFHIAGYRREGRTSVPYVLVGHTTREPEIRRVNATEQGALQYGVVRAGDVLVANRMIDENYLPLFGAMPLQEAIDYACTSSAQRSTRRAEPRFPQWAGRVLVVQPTGCAGCSAGYGGGGISGWWCYVELQRMTRCRRSLSSGSPRSAAGAAAQHQVSYC